MFPSFQQNIEVDGFEYEIESISVSVASSGVDKAVGSLTQLERREDLNFSIRSQFLLLGSLELRL